MKKRLTIVLAAVTFAICVIHPVEAADKTPEQLVKETKAVIKEVSIEDVKKMLSIKCNSEDFRTTHKT